MPLRDASCNTMLPAEEQYNLTFEPPRPPGPSKGRLAFDAPAGPAPAAPTSTPTRIVVPYDFDGLVGFNHPRFLTQALSAARTLNARTIEIVGYRGAVRLSKWTDHCGGARHRQAAGRTGGHAVEGCGTHRTIVRRAMAGAAGEAHRR